MKMTQITTALAAALLMAGCQSQGNIYTPEARQDIAQASPSAVCDEHGRIYSNEDAARRAGLDESQYGATYCEVGKGPEAE